MADPEFTPSDHMVLRASADAQRTVRRRRIAIATGCSVLAGLGAAFGHRRSWLSDRNGRRVKSSPRRAARGPAGRWPD